MEPVVGAVAQLLLAATLALHPNSLSSSRIEVAGSEAHLVLRGQVLSYLEVIEGLDADGDGAVTAAEVVARRSEILDYVARHYRVFTGTDRDMDGGIELAAEPGSVTFSGEVGDGPVPFLGGRIDVEMRYLAPASIEDLMVDVALFRRTSPDHVDFASIHWSGEEPDLFGIGARAPRARSDPTGRGAFGMFFRLGFDHIMSGFDHLAFVLALVFASRRLRSLLGVVTAFTLAHSVTLGLSAIDVIDLSAHAPLVEAIIALSISFVAVDALVRTTVTRTRWPEAFGFGLVHGLGFAGFLGASLVHEKARATALFAFNVGVEFGQVLVVVGLVAVFRLARRGGDGPPPEFLVPRPVRVAGLVVVAVLGLWWFVERI